MMSELYRACGSERKHFAKFPGGTHNETWSCAHYYNTISYFLEEVAEITIFPPDQTKYKSSVRSNQPPPTLVQFDSTHTI